MKKQVLSSNILKEYIKCSLKTLKGFIYSTYLRTKKSNHDLWLISERGNDARDNGYVFYKYLREQHPEVNAVYVIDKASVDYERVKGLGRTVQYGSAEHYALIFVASKLISSHIMGFTPCPGFFVGVDKRVKLFKAQKIFLQHGIIKDNIEGLKYPNTDVDLFICGAKPEYEYIKNNYNYPRDVVQYTGLARYDNLMNFRTKKQILLMPTWRKWINSNNDGDFVKSEYFLKYQSLISNKKLNTLLINNGYELVFYPHYEMQKFIHNFVAGEAVHIAKFSEYDVQDLLKRCEVLVTDYSSVYFDVAYMEKPIGFYQFDKKQFFKSHYARGYIEEEKFGYVTDSEDELVNFIRLCIHNEYSLDEVNKYRKSFFVYHDSNNSERIFKEVQKL